MLDKNLSYSHRSFRSTDPQKNKVIWTLTGTFSDGSRTEIKMQVPEHLSKTLLRCVDTFTNQKGGNIKYYRWQILDAINKKQIEPVFESKIIHVESKVKRRAV